MVDTTNIQIPNKSGHKRRKIDLRLKDVETAYLYGPLDNEIYIKFPEGIELSNATGSRELKYTSIC